MNKLSVVIITKNEAHIIERCIVAAKKISDDIVVVDSFSTDETPVICKKLKVNFQQKEWLGYGAQKNYANSLAENDWILSLDADELLSDKLVVEILSLNFNNDNAIFSIHRLTNYCGKWIHYGKWRTDNVLRIFNRKSVQWNQKAVHENVTVLPKHQLKYLKESLHHYSIKSISDHVEKINRYTDLFAQENHQKGKKASFIKLYINPVYKFYVDYFFRLGFLDGFYGFSIAVLSSYETFLKYAKLKSLTKSKF